MSLVDVQFEGDIHMPFDEQQRIATALKQRGYPALTAATASLIETEVRNSWQERGYFNVSVGKTEIRTILSSHTSTQIAATVQVEDGLQYRLGSVTFKDNKAVRNPEFLRTLLPIADEQLFDVSKVRAGLGKLRTFAVKHGYVNFTAVPDAQVDDEHQTISLVIDIDEGKQFRVSSAKVIGLDGPRSSTTGTGLQRGSCQRVPQSARYIIACWPGSHF